MEKNIWFKNNGQIKTDLTLEHWINEVQSEGAGEILLNSIDRDGTKKGYDFKILNSIKIKLKFH